MSIDMTNCLYRQSRMASGNSIFNLQNAVEVERLAAEKLRWRYAALTAKINAYQDGTGASPSPEEFSQWQEDLEAIRKLGQLHHGPI